jgi:hypothetical protein
MLTKGDVLAFLGKASGPLGSYKDTTLTPADYKAQAKRANASGPPRKVCHLFYFLTPGLKRNQAPLDAPGIRKAILTSLLADSVKSRTPTPSPSKNISLQDIITC